MKECSTLSCITLHVLETAQAGVLGSSLLAMVPPSCVGLAQHARLGNVDWRMAAGLAAGTAVGSFAGSKVAVDAPAGKCCSCVFSATETSGCMSGLHQQHAEMLMTPSMTGLSR